MKLEFGERDYASHLDLIAKVHGFVKAENYFASIPDLVKGEVIYITLLVSDVSATDLMKAEDVFNKMRDLGFSMTASACNQLLLLYKRLDRKKIPDVLYIIQAMLAKYYVLEGLNEKAEAVLKDMRWG